jgi:predicted transposase/invertase (TIGR01784 family)
MMRGALIDTSARRILNQGIKQGINQGITETKKRTALNMLKRGKMTIEEIAEDTDLSVAEVEHLAKLQTV